MKFNSFEQLPDDLSSVEDKEQDAEQAGVREPSAEAIPQKIDRRAKIAPKEKPLPGSDAFLESDIPVDELKLQAARDYFRVNGNENPTEEEVRECAQTIVFSEMPPEELSQRIYNSLVQDPHTREKIVDKANTALKTDFVISEQRRIKEEKEKERLEMGRRTAEVIAAAKKAKEDSRGGKGPLAA